MITKDNKLELPCNAKVMHDLLVFLIKTEPIKVMDFTFAKDI